MKIQTPPIFFLLVIVVGTGCRTSAPLGQAEQDGTGIDWQNHTPVEFGTPLNLPLHVAIEKGNLDTVRELLAGQVPRWTLGLRGSLAAAPVAQLLGCFNLQPIKRRLPEFESLGIRSYTGTGRFEGQD